MKSGKESRTEFRKEEIAALGQDRDEWREGAMSKDVKILALEQRILELESANAVEHEKIRDEALVSATKVQCEMCRLMDMPKPSNGGYYRHRNGRLCPLSGVHQLRRPR